MNRELFVLCLLPLSFAVHDAEEVLFLPAWLRRNRTYLRHRFPRFAARLLPRLERITSRRFAWMAAEELALLTGATAYGAVTGNLFPWLALFSAFGIHLWVHLGQWIAVGRYVPGAGSSLLALCCCAWGLHTLRGAFTLRELALSAVAGCAVAALNLWLLHRLAAGRG